MTKLKKTSYEFFIANNINLLIWESWSKGGKGGNEGKTYNM